MSHPYVASELVKGEVADPGDECQSKKPVRPVPARVIRSYIAPCKLIQAGNVGGIESVLSHGIMGASPTDCVQRQENGKYDTGRRDEDFQEHPQIAKEKVCIEPALLHEFRVRG